MQHVPDHTSLADVIRRTVLGYMQNCPVNSEKYQNALYA